VAEPDDPFHHTSQDKDGNDYGQFEQVEMAKMPFAEDNHSQSSLRSQYHQRCSRLQTSC